MSTYEEVEIPPGYVEVYSRRDRLTKQPVIGTCTIFVGGSTPVAFEDGRAVVPTEVAGMLAQRGDISTPSGTAGTTETPPPVGAGPGAVVQPLAVPEELAGLSAEQLRAVVALVTHPGVAAAALQAVGEAPLGTAPDDPDTDGGGGPPMSAEEREAALAAAREHLGDEDLGEDATPPLDDLAPPAFPIPGGFALLTPDGQRRCLAAKGDGGQCNNPARPSTFACAMPLHVTKVAELAASGAPDG